MSSILVPPLSFRLFTELWEDGALQALLEDAGFAFAGCDAASSEALHAQGNSKDRVSEAGVRVVRDIRFREPREVSAAEVIEELGEDLVVKPADQGSSVALHICHGEEELGKSYPISVTVNG